MTKTRRTKRLIISDKRAADNETFTHKRGPARRITQPHVAERLSRCIAAQEKHEGAREKRRGEGRRGRRKARWLRRRAVAASESAEESQAAMMNYCARVALSWMSDGRGPFFPSSRLSTDQTAASTPRPQGAALAAHSL